MIEVVMVTLRYEGFELVRKRKSVIVPNLQPWRRVTFPQCTIGT